MNTNSSEDDNVSYKAKKELAQFKSDLIAISIISFFILAAVIIAILATGGNKFFSIALVIVAFLTFGIWAESNN